MTAVYIDNRLLHYEVFGRGQPIIFLHSWLGSWRYWVSTMEATADRWRSYAVDFWGFGESDRTQGTFTLSEYADCVLGFLDKLGIQRTNLVGHGLGGMVAIRVAAERPERIGKVMTVCAPIEGHTIASLARPGSGAIFSRLIGRTSPTNLWARFLRQSSITDKQTYDEIIEDTESLSEHVVTRVLETVGQTDLRADLQSLQVPLLAVYGEKDALVSHDQALLFDRTQSATIQVLTLPRSAHFPFLEQPNVFARLLKDFLTSQGTPVEIKEEWRRRVNQREYI